MDLGDLLKIVRRENITGDDTNSILNEVYAQIATLSKVNQDDNDTKRQTHVTYVKRWITKNDTRPVTVLDINNSPIPVKHVNTRNGDSPRVIINTAHHYVNASDIRNSLSILNAQKNKNGKLSRESELLQIALESFLRSRTEPCTVLIQHVITINNKPHNYREFCPDTGLLLQYDSYEPSILNPFSTAYIERKLSKIEANLLMLGDGFKTLNEPGYYLKLGAIHRGSQKVDKYVDICGEIVRLPSHIPHDYSTELEEDEEKLAMTSLEVGTDGKREIKKLYISLEEARVKFGMAESPEEVKLNRARGDKGVELELTLARAQIERDKLEHERQVQELRRESENDKLEAKKRILELEEASRRMELEYKKKTQDHEMERTETMAEITKRHNEVKLEQDLRNNERKSVSDVEVAKIKAEASSNAKISGAVVAVGVVAALNYLFK